MKPRDYVNKLLEAGKKPAWIVAEIKQLGVNTSQPTISRISTGVTPDPAFSLGDALRRVYEKHQQEQGQEKTKS